MKRLKKFTKGMLIAVMLAMTLSLASNVLHQGSSLTAVPTAYAQEGDEPAEEKTFDDHRSNLPESKGPQNQQNSEEIVSKVANLASWTHRLFAPMINFFAYQIGNFLGHDYVFGGAMGDMLQKIWVISRNIVNIAFVFLLLWMALKEIFFIGQESDLKKNLIKFVLLLVAVNFSWLGTKLVLDAASVATHVVFAIPSGISNPPEYGQCTVNDPQDPITGSCYPTAIIAPTDAGESNPLYWEDTEGEDDHCSKVIEAYDDAYNEDGTRNESASEENKKFQGRTSICVENLNLLSYDQNTAVIYLTYGMARIQNLVNATAGNDPVQLSVGVLMSLIIQLAYTTALLALFIALIIRMAMLWFFVGFSPFLVLVIWFSGAEDKDFGEFKFGIKEFVNWAFVPAKVGAVFAVSFIMISAGQAVGNVKTTLFDNASSKSGFVFRILEPQSLFMGIDGLQNFIWLLMSLVVLWLGVFAVLSKMSIVNKVTDRISDYGKSVGKLVATSPYWAPVLPLGKGGEKTSVRDVVKGVDLRGKLESYAGIQQVSSEARELNAKAGTARAREAVTGSLTKIGSGSFSTSDANRLALAHGFKDLHNMMRMERDVLKKAFTKSGISEGDADKLYDALQKESRATKGLTGALDRTAAKPAEKPAGPPGTAQPPAAPKAPPAGGGTPPPAAKPPAK